MDYLIKRIQEKLLARGRAEQERAAEWQRSLKPTIYRGNNLFQELGGEPIEGRYLGQVGLVPGQSVPNIGRNPNKPVIPGLPAEPVPAPEEGGVVKTEFGFFLSKISSQTGVDQAVAYGVFLYANGKVKKIDTIEPVWRPASVDWTETSNLSQSNIAGSLSRTIQYTEDSYSVSIIGSGQSSNNTNGGELGDSFQFSERFPGAIRFDLSYSNSVDSQASLGDATATSFFFVAPSRDQGDTALVFNPQRTFVSLGTRSGTGFGTSSVLSYSSSWQPQEKRPFLSSSLYLNLSFLAGWYVLSAISPPGSINAEASTSLIVSISSLEVLLPVNITNRWFYVNKSDWLFWIRTDNFFETPVENTVYSDEYFFGYKGRGSRLTETKVYARRTLKNGTVQYASAENVESLVYSETPVDLNDFYTNEFSVYLSWDDAESIATLPIAQQEYSYCYRLTPPNYFLIRETPSFRITIVADESTYSLAPVLSEAIFPSVENPNVVQGSTNDGLAFPQDIYPDSITVSNYVCSLLLNLTIPDVFIGFEEETGIIIICSNNDLFVSEVQLASPPAAMDEISYSIDSISGFDIFFSNTIFF